MMAVLKHTLLIAMGGAVGAVCRFWCTEFVHAFFEKGFPFGTLLVNILGSLLMGYLSVLFFKWIVLADDLRSFVLIGLLGAFTTFSTFSLDTVTLIQEGRYYWALIYVVLSLSLCVSAAGAGIWLAEYL